MFTQDSLAFLAELAEHNEREWFNDHKDRYVAHIKQAAYDFIDAMRPALTEISPHIRCDEKALFRIYRDTRFGKDKTPYKTHVGVHFRHRDASSAHSPGLYLHLAPHEAFFGAGIWRPDRDALAKIRGRIAADPSSFTALEEQLAASGFSFAGDSLKRIPKGYDKDHPMAEALRRKDAIVVMDLEPDEVVAAGFAHSFADHCRGASPLIADLCRTLELAW